MLVFAITVDAIDVLSATFIMKNWLDSSLKTKSLKILSMPDLKYLSDCNLDIHISDIMLSSLIKQNQSIREKHINPVCYQPQKLSRPWLILGLNQKMDEMVCQCLFRALCFLDILDLENYRFCF